MTTVRNQRSLLIITLMTAVCLFNFPVYAKYIGGSGTVEDPYQIATVEDLIALSEEPNDYDKHFILTADIDLNPNLPERKVFDKAVIAPDTNPNSVFFRGTPFTGVFDGNGHTISNLTIVGINYLGLFGRIESGATVRDIGLLYTNITGSGDKIGSLIGVNFSESQLIRCFSTGVVNDGEYYIGGLVGDNYGVMTHCYTAVVVNGRGFIGGLVGKNSGEVVNCYSTGMVRGSWGFIGGLVGGNVGTITDCYSIGSLRSGGRLVGGLVGGNFDPGRDWIQDGITIDCFWDMETSGRTTSGGGTGLTTAEMQMASTFMEAGWDFVDETDNGTDDIWWILEGQAYPRLRGLPEDPKFHPFLAFCPDPKDGAIDVVQSPLLSWVQSNRTLQHDIYFGQDKEAVANATTLNLEVYRGRQSAEITTYDPGHLEWDKTYYWRIDEVDVDETIRLGHVWSFTTANFIVVDDIEDYTNLPPDQIWETWIDGYGDPNNGSIVGYLLLYTPVDVSDDELHYVETWIVHSGRQSMPYFYDTDFKYSEATMTLRGHRPRDWTQDDVGVLSLWFHGGEWNDTEQMYIAIANIGGESAAVYHNNPDALLVEDWMEWTIDLTNFSDQAIDLTDVATISIGFGHKNNLQPGGEGWVLFDDVRLYRLPPEP